MRDIRYRYHNAIKIWSEKLMKNKNTDIGSLQQQLYDVEGLQRNLDWFREELTNMLIEAHKEK